MARDGLDGLDGLDRLDVLDDLERTRYRTLYIIR